MTASRVSDGSQQARNMRESESWDATAPIRALRTVDLSADNIATQFTGTQAINQSSSFTLVPDGTASRLPQVVVGASHNETVYTLSGTSLSGETISEDLTVAAGAGTTKYSRPFATITSFVTTTAPGDTVDLQWGDTWVEPAARCAIVGTAGDIACRLVDDSTDITLSGVTAGVIPVAVKIVRITSTTAAGITLGW